MTSNLDRSLYNMVKMEHKTNKKKILATYSQTYNIKNSKLIVMYYPKVNSKNEPTVFYDSQ